MTGAKRTLLIVVAASITAMVLWLAIFPPPTSRIFQNQRRTVASLRYLNLAEQQYAARNADKAFACKLSDFADRSGASSGDVFVDAALASGVKNGYQFDLRCPSATATAYTITAIPTKPGTTGEYALCTDQNGKIWYSQSGSASDCLAARKPVGREYE